MHSCSQWNTDSHEDNVIVQLWVLQQLSWGSVLCEFYQSQHNGQKWSRLQFQEEMKAHQPLDGRTGRHRQSMLLIASAQLACVSSCTVSHIKGCYWKGLLKILILWCWRTESVSASVLRWSLLITTHNSNKPANVTSTQRTNKRRFQNEFLPPSGTKPKWRKGASTLLTAASSAQAGGRESEVNPEWNQQTAVSIQGHEQTLVMQINSQGNAELSSGKFCKLFCSHNRVDIFEGHRSLVDANNNTTIESLYNYKANESLLEIFFSPGLQWSSCA